MGNDKAGLGLMDLFMEKEVAAIIDNKVFTSLPYPDHPRNNAIHLQMSDDVSIPLFPEGRVSDYESKIKSENLGRIREQIQERLGELKLTEHKEAALGIEYQQLRSQNVVLSFIVEELFPYYEKSKDPNPSKPLKMAAKDPLTINRKMNLDKKLGALFNPFLDKMKIMEKDVVSYLTEEIQKAGYLYSLPKKNLLLIDDTAYDLELQVGMKKGKDGKKSESASILVRAGSETYTVGNPTTMRAIEEGLYHQMLSWIDARLMGFDYTSENITQLSQKIENLKSHIPLQSKSVFDLSYQKHQDGYFVYLQIPQYLLKNKETFESFQFPAVHPSLFLIDSQGKPFVESIYPRPLEKDYVHPFVWDRKEYLDKNGHKQVCYGSNNLSEMLADCSPRIRIIHALNMAKNVLTDGYAIGVVPVHALTKENFPNNFRGVLA